MPIIRITKFLADELRELMRRHGQNGSTFLIQPFLNDDVRDRGNMPERALAALTFRLQPFVIVDDRLDVLNPFKDDFPFTAIKK